jgi:hypothetical protein
MSKKNRDKTRAKKGGKHMAIRNQIEKGEKANNKIMLYAL